MNNNKELLKALKDKERELIEEIESTPLGIQLKGVRSTMALFEKPTSNDDFLGTDDKIEIPNTYQDAATWNDKILFALNKIKSGFVDDIVTELKKLDTTLDESILKRKVTVIASGLKSSKKIGAKTIGIKSKYFIK